MKKIKINNDFIIQNRNTFIFLFIVFFWVAFFGISGRWFSGFGLPANHKTILLNEELEVENFKPVLIKEIKRDQNLRFRPFYVFQSVVKTKIFGINSTWWVVFNNILAILTTFLLFRFTQYMKFPLFGSFLFLFFLMIGKQSEIWWVVPHNETISMFLFSLSLYFMVLGGRRPHPIHGQPDVVLSGASSQKPGFFASFYRILTQRGRRPHPIHGQSDAVLSGASSQKLFYKIFFLFFTFLMSLSKESFLLLIPGLMFLYVWISKENAENGWIESIKKNFFMILILSLIFLTEVAYIKLKGVKGLGYAGLEFNLNKFFKAALTLFKAGNFFTIILPLSIVILIFSYFNKNKTSLKASLNEFKIIAVLCLIIVVPQIVIYSKSGFQNRYLIPGLLVFSLVLAYIYKFISIHFPKAFKRAFIVLILLFGVFPTGINTWNGLNSFTRKGFQLKALFNSILQNTKEKDSILVVADPAYNVMCYSFKVFLNQKYKRNNVIYKLFETRAYSTFEKIKINRNYKRLNPVLLVKIKSKNKIKGVVIFPGLEKNFLETASDWFDYNSFERYDIKSAVLYIKKSEIKEIR